jgi:hypothetical protein
MVAGNGFAEFLREQLTPLGRNSRPERGCPINTNRQNP